MKGRGAWLLVLALLAMMTALPASAADPPALTETQVLKAENLRLKFALLQQQEAQLREAAQKLEADRISLEAEFRAALKASPSQTFNWQTLRFDGAGTVGAPVQPPTQGQNGGSAQPNVEKPPGD